MNKKGMWSRKSTPGCKPRRKQSLRRYLYIHINSNSIDDGQKVEATQVSMDKWMGKQGVVYVYKRCINLNSDLWMKPGGIMLSGKASNKYTNVTWFFS
jgi:hypothetical protein